MPLDIGERGEQRLAERRWRVEITVVGARLPGVLPEPLRRIEVRRVGRQREHLELAVVLGKIRQDFGLLVIRGVVLNQIDPMAAAVVMR